MNHSISLTVSFLLYNKSKKEPNDRHQKSRQKIKRLAVLQVKQRKPTTCNEQSTNNEQLRHERVTNGSTGYMSHKPEQALPAEQHRSCQDHANAIG